MLAIRQGDVLLVRLRGLPKGARRRKEAIARIPGENGNAHVLSGATLWEHDGRPIAVVEPGATALLEHDEHAPVALEAGVWEIRTPRVFDWPQTPRRLHREEKVRPVQQSQDVPTFVPYVD